MNAEERRELIKNKLKNNEGPIVARNLASSFDVSRQVIVGDIALLRAAGVDIHSTPKGYVMRKAQKEGVTTQLVFNHLPEETKEELYTIVDNGGEVIDVLVEHPIYGIISGELNVSNRVEADEFLDKVKEYDNVLLSNLTEGIHTHTIYAKNESLLRRIEEVLSEKGFLYK